MSYVDFVNALIEQIKLYPILYNSQDQDYRNHLKKRRAWEKIASFLNTDVETCEKKWFYLRGHYTRLRAKRPSNGTGPHAPITWPYFEHMEFFESYILQRSSISNEAIISEDDIQERITDVSSLSHFTSPTYRDEHDSNNDWTFETIEDISSQSHSPMPEITTLVGKRRKLQFGDKIQEILQTSSHACLGSNQELDDTDLFYLSLAKKAKKIPNLKRNELERKLLEIVHEYT